jgi:senataxin
VLVAELLSRPSLLASTILSSTNTIDTCCMTDSTGEKEKLQRTLKGLRDQPVSSEDARPFLAPLFDFLVKVPVNSNDGLLHWFCDRSYEPLVSEAATFLLRLHAYNSSKVQQYKKLLAEVLTGCAGCVKGLQEAKVTSRKT